MVSTFTWGQGRCWEASSLGSSPAISYVMELSKLPQRLRQKCRHILRLGPETRQAFWIAEALAEAVCNAKACNQTHQTHQPLMKSESWPTSASFLVSMTLKGNFFASAFWSCFFRATFLRWQSKLAVKSGHKTIHFFEKQVRLGEGNWDAGSLAVRSASHADCLRNEASITNQQIAHSLWTIEPSRLLYYLSHHTVVAEIHGIYRFHKQVCFKHLKLGFVWKYGTPKSNGTFIGSSFSQHENCHFTGLSPLFQPNAWDFWNHGTSRSASSRFPDLGKELSLLFVLGQWQLQLASTDGKSKCS